MLKNVKPNVWYLDLLLATLKAWCWSLYCSGSRGDKEKGHAYIAYAFWVLEVVGGGLFLWLGWFGLRLWHLDSGLTVLFIVLFHSLGAEVSNASDLLSSLSVHCVNSAVQWFVEQPPLARVRQPWPLIGPHITWRPLVLVWPWGWHRLLWPLIGQMHKHRPLIGCYHLWWRPCLLQQSCM